MATRKEMRERLGGQRFNRSGQLAFAYSIGMAYRRVEFTTRQDNQIDPWSIWWALNGGVSGPQEVAKENTDKIKGWLEVPATLEQVALVKAHRDAFMTRKQERAEHIRALRFGKKESAPDARSG